MTSEVLSDVLRTVRLTGAIFFDVTSRAPWVAEAPPTADLAEMVMPGAEHVIEYHVVLSGVCWAARSSGDNEPPVRLEPGSIVIFPHGHGHVLSSAPGMRARPEMDLYRLPGDDERLPHVLRKDEGDEETQLICGFLGCDRRPFNPLIEALPPMIHIEDGFGGDGMLAGLVKATVAESRSRRLGGESVLSRLSELIFIEVVRRYAEALPAEATGWFAALDDPQVGQVLRLMHAEPARAWTLPDLAREAGLSRTALAERFAAALGAPPMTYLQNWRMQIASSLLAAGALTVAQVAEAVGYDSEAAFSRAFKRVTGISPGARRGSSTKPIAPAKAGVQALQN